MKVSAPPPPPTAAALESQRSHTRPRALANTPPAVPSVDERGEGHKATPHQHTTQGRDSDCAAEKGMFERVSGKEASLHPTWLSRKG